MAAAAAAVAAAVGWGGGQGEGVFTDLGCRLEAAGSRPGDLGSRGQEAWPLSSSGWTKTTAVQAPTSQESRGSRKEQGLRPWPSGE